MTQGEDVIKDAIQRLGGWTGDDIRLTRTLAIDDGQHAELTERIKIYADALDLQPDVSRFDGRTRIQLSRPEGVTSTEVTFAARVEDAYRNIAGPEATADIPRPRRAISAWFHRRQRT